MGVSDQPAYAIAFVCVQNAGRSQMAAAFAEREVNQRGLGGAVDVRTGGTDPADAVHPVVVDAMAERGVDLTDAEPREIGREALLAVDLVVTMGCSAADVCPATYRGDSVDWALEDPHERPIEEVREIRDEIENRVVGLLDDIEADVSRRV